MVAWAIGAGGHARIVGGDDDGGTRSEPTAVSALRSGDGRFGVCVNPTSEN